MSEDEGREVKLHVYDLSQGMAAQLSKALTGRQIDGIWHSGVVVGGVEYYWGGELMAEPAGSTQYGRPVRVISLGRTFIPDEVIREFVDDVRPMFNPSTYSLLSHNCNNFSNELATFLTGHGIPEDIVGLPDEVLSTPFGQMIRPFIEQMERQQKNMYGTSATLTTPELQRQAQQTSTQPVTNPAPATTSAPAPSSAASTPAAPVLPKVEEPKKMSLLEQNNTVLLSLQRVYKPYIAKLRAGGKTPEPVLKSVESALSATSEAEVKADPAVVDFISQALNTWTEVECVPVLYILRELATVPAYQTYYITNSECIDALCIGLERCGVESERPAPCLLTMAVSSNLFASAEIADYLRSSEHALNTLFFETGLKNLKSNTKAIGQMAAALVFNFTLKPIQITEQQISDIVNGFCAALCRESSAPVDTDFEQRCVLALGHFIENHSSKAISIVKQSKLHSYLMKRKDDRDVPTNADICNEICAYLQSH